MSARSALQLAHARGILLAALASEAVVIHEYAPAAVKRTVCGSGRADKGQIQSMMRRVLGSGAPASLPPDVADALAVALCHLSHARFAEAVARTRSRP